MSTPRRRALGPMQPAGFVGNARFEIKRTLGEGGTGVVYEAFDSERDMPVALKTIRYLDAQSLFRLKTEFRARADLEHRNLVRLGELFHDDGHWFFTMELLEGVSFLEWVRGDDVLDERRLRSALRQLAGGLDVLHRAGLVHRDLKPSNVLVTDKGRLVILDFGLVARARDGDLSDPGIVGTAAYMSPEQALSRPAGPAADWYSMGVMLYEALSGRVPVDGAPVEILLKKQSAAPAPLDGVPADLAELCLDLLAIDAARRPIGAAVLRRLDAPAAAEDGAPAFVGRVDELAALDGALAEVRDGATIAVQIEGESGIGKTALVAHFAAKLAGDEQTLVLTGRCHERETVPFRGLDGVVDALSRAFGRFDLGEVALPSSSELVALAQLFPVLLRVPAIARLSSALPTSPSELRARAFRGLRNLLDILASHRPLVAIIEDIHWADSDTIGLLREILHPPGAPRLLLVLTHREGSAPDLHAPMRTLRLERLSDGESAGLIQLVAPHRHAETDALVAGASGHPMFLRELLRHVAPPRGADLGDALWARITRMETPARRILEVVALSGKPLPQSLVAEALGLDGRSSAKWLGVLRAASLVRTGGTRAADPVEPYHDRVRAAVLVHIAPGRRRRIHERLASLLIASGHIDRDPLTVIAHLEAAGRLNDAARLARRAARAAGEAILFEQVAALTRAALRLLPEGPAHADERLDLQMRLAEALACAGRGPEAAAWFLEASAHGDAEHTFRCRQRAAEQLLVSGHVLEGLRLLDDVLQAIGERMPRSPRAARRRLIWRWLRLRVRGTSFKEKPRALASPRDRVRLDVYRTASLGLGMVDAVTGAAFQARAVLVALRVGDRRHVAYALTYHAMYVGAAGGRFIARARELVAQATAIAHAANSPFLKSWTLAGDGVVAYFAGDLERAATKLLEAEVQMRESTVGTSAELGHLRMFLLWALRRRGAFAELRSHYVEYVRDAIRRGDRYAATTFRWSSNVVWLAADDVERAHAEIAAGTWSAPEHGLHLQHWFLARSRCELALYEGDAAALAASERELRGFRGGVLDHVEVVRAETALELGRIAITRGDADGARAALAGMRAHTAPYLRAMAMLIDAAADTLDGHRARARAHLESALALAEDTGMPAIAALALRRMGEVTVADARLRDLGVIAPARFASVFATWPTDR